MNFFSEMGEAVKVIIRKDLYNFIKQSPNRQLENKLNYMESRLLEVTHCPSKEVCAFKRSLRHFKSEFRKKWAASHNIEERFLKNNIKWLAGSIKLTTWTRQKLGRPSKVFQECSDRSKRRKTKHLREQVPAEQLTFAAHMSLRAAGESDASTVIKEITKSPTRAKKIRNAMANKRPIELI